MRSNDKRRHLAIAGLLFLDEPFPPDGHDGGRKGKPDEPENKPSAWGIRS